MKLLLVGATSIISRCTRELLCKEVINISKSEMQAYVTACLNAGPAMLLSIEAVLYKHNVKITDFLLELKGVPGYQCDDKYSELFKLAEARELDQQIMRESKQKFSVQLRNRNHSLQYRAS